MSGFAAQIGQDGSIQALQQAAAWRSAEAELLNDAGRHACFSIRPISAVELTMPVIRTRVFESSTVLEDVLRRELSRELQTQPSDDQPLLQPLVFENENSTSGGLNVWVVWEKWKLLPAAQRAKIIYEAYETAHRGESSRIVTANAVTTQEAIELGLLPWRVECTESDSHEGPRLRELMRSEGAIDIDAGLVLRFPDRQRAEAARDRLEHLSNKPNAWTIEEDASAA